ncbi:MAG TPA: Uma2 family endonuclease [Chthonomonadaceae bacterium]|nr:Uma2 family endonuclease [Chthonomonadaceae bacterium]
MMTQILEPTPSTPPGRVRWTREAVEALQQSGFLDSERRYEVIDGEIIEMSDNPPHRFCVRMLFHFLMRVFGAERACYQSAIQTSKTDPVRNNPIPDASVTREPDAAYAARFPGPDDLLLVGEVSDSTLAYDLGEKALLYARADIPEYWVLDIQGRHLIVHRQPGQDGYADIRLYPEGEEAATLSRPETKTRVSDLLPPTEVPTAP